MTQACNEPSAPPAEAYCPACGVSYAPDESSCPADGARLVRLGARVDPMLGRVLEGRYEIRAVLGAGGMGTVYRGHQLSVDRPVAIKVIHPVFAADRTAVKRFLREARLSSRIAQPSIVSVYDFGQTDAGELYLVMELLRGHALERDLDARQPMSVHRVAGIGLQLCNALEAAHGEGIIHRDLKPANIIVLDSPADVIKVLDFGLARSLANEDTTRVTMSNAILGTPMYMAPEQIRGRVADQRADLYALGCILFHMLVGRAPFDSNSVNGVLAAHLDDPIPPLPAAVPADLAREIHRLLAKEPEQRAASVADVRAALQAAIAPPAVSKPAVKRSRRWVPALAAFAVAMIVGGVVIARYRPADAPPPAPAASLPSTPAPVESAAKPPPIEVSPPAPSTAVPPPRHRAVRATPSKVAPKPPTLDFYPSTR